MNLVDLLKDQLSGKVLEHLSSLIGANEGTTRSAVGAAVPALLSALSGLASNNSGAQKLVSALGQLGGGTAENLVHTLSDHPANVLEQGSGLMNSLFGSSIVTGIANTLARHIGIPPSVAQKLLSYLMPMVLGAIAGRFAGKSVTTQALSSLFAEQKSSIAHAMPSGFSLNEVPGLAAAGSAVRSTARAADATGSSVMRWLLPLLAVCALGLLVWWLAPWGSTVEPAAPASTVPASVPSVAANVPVPDATKLSTELTDTFKTLTDTLTGIKDVPTAEAALPKLQEVGPKLDAAKATLQKMGDTGKAAIKTLVQSSLTKLKELVEKVLAIPGVGDKIKPAVDTIMAKLGELAE